LLLISIVVIFILNCTGFSSKYAYFVEPKDVESVWEKHFKSGNPRTEVLDILLCLWMVIRNLLN